MVVGMRLPPTPAPNGKLLIQKTEQLTIIMTIFAGILSNERVCRTDLVHSLMTLIYSSTSETFSSAMVILISTLGILSLMASNIFLLLIKLTTKPYLAYNDMNLVIPLANWDIF